MSMVMAGIAFLCLAGPTRAQFTPLELSERSYWETYLKTAEIIKAEQPWDDKEAITRPWKLTLFKDGLTKNAIWKNCQGEQHGFQENWRWEIAAYLLDKTLGLNMVPPTVERRFQGCSGSLQLWVDSEMSLRKKIQNNITTPSDKGGAWLRAGWLQQAFDNLIANEDRHTGNVLVTKDFRAILIDHSRTFRASSSFTNRLLFGQDKNQNTVVMHELPRAFVENLRGMNYMMLHRTAGDYLTEKEIMSVLKRCELLLAWIDDHINVKGEITALSISQHLSQVEVVEVVPTATVREISTALGKTGDEKLEPSFFQHLSQLI